MRSHYDQCNWPSPSQQDEPTTGRAMRTARDELRVHSRRAAAALGALMRVMGVSDSHVGRAVGLTRQMIRFKRTTGAWYIDDVFEFAEAFGVPPHVFWMEADDVFRWYADQNPKPLLRPRGSTAVERSS